MDKEDISWPSWLATWETLDSNTTLLLSLLKLLCLGKRFRRCAIQWLTEFKVIAESWALKRNLLYHLESHKYFLSNLGLWHWRLCLHLFWIHLPGPSWPSGSLLTDIGLSKIRNHETRRLNFSSSRSGKVEKEIFGKKYRRDWSKHDKGP